METNNAILVAVFHVTDSTTGSLVNMMRRWFLECSCHKSHVSPAHIREKKTQKQMILQCLHRKIAVRENGAPW